MQTISLKELTDKIENDEIQYNQLYGADIEASHHYSIQHYIENENDNIDTDQILKILFFDIEVYNFHREKFDFNNANGVINAITIYDTKSKTYNAFLLVMPAIINKVDMNNKQQYIDKIQKELLDYKYIQEDEKINIFMYLDDEISMIEDCWKMIHSLDPAILSGFNADGFDLPYFYKRLTTLYQDEKRTAQTLSKFGVVKTRSYGSGFVLYQIPEMPVCDVRRLYMPRNEGGLNYGKTLANYSLDAISEKELKLKKIEYNDTGMSLDQFYEHDPINFLKYNIVDVALPVRLNEKLKHIDLHNMLRRDMKTPFTASLIGVSSLFSAMFNYELEKRNQKMRWGLLAESSNSISELDIENIERPKVKKMNWNVQKIDEPTYRKVLSRYVGAYVKDSPGGLYTVQDGIIIDQDATALYPSMMLQNNISFDAYYGRVIDPVAYKFIEYLRSILGTDKTLHPSIKSDIFEKIKKRVDILSPQNKNDYKQYLYYMFMNILQKIKDVNVPIDTMMKPKSISDILLLKTYFIPLIDLIVEINKDPEYHTFAYDYIINHEDPEYGLYIIENENEPYCQIVKIPGAKFKEYLVENNISFNLAGAMFYKKEHKIGILNQFLVDRLKMRKLYKTKRDEYKKGTEEYKYFDRTQLSCKVNINSSYGLTGLSSFQFSNRQLALTTTLSGRLAIKLAQECGEMYLNKVYKDL